VTLIERFHWTYLGRYTSDMKIRAQWVTTDTSQTSGTPVKHERKWHKQFYNQRGSPQRSGMQLETSSKHKPKTYTL